MSKPALTAEEWKATRRFPPNVIYQGERKDGTINRHAMAALCLRGQEFGFSHEDVEALTGLDIADLKYMRAMDGERGELLARRINSIRDRIAALLPPESP